jgi:hypothetical protein
MKVFLTGIAALFYLLPHTCTAQDQSQDQPGLVDRISNFPSSFFRKANSEATNLNQKITQQTEKYLQRLAKKEEQLRKKMFRQDSAAAARTFGNNPIDYNALIQKLKGDTGAISSKAGSFTGTTYIPYLDSIKTSIKFAQQNPQLFSNSAQWQGQLNGSLTQVQQLQAKIQATSQVQQLIQQRQAQIRQSLSQYTHLPPGLQSSYQGYSQQAYYYAAQLKEYKDELSNPDKLTQRALGILNQSPRFQSFMKSHSDLAGLFSIPGGGGVSNPKALAGLQTRSVVQQQLQAQVSSGGPNAQQMVQQQIQSAKAQLQKLKDKVSQMGGGSSAMPVADFRPNTQKTKPLLGRLEWGLNIQSLPSTYVLPVTTDFGASLGYKLSDKNTIGLGASYKMGWGSDLGHISITSQGVGLRSFLTTKLKGSLSAYGGFEYNYQQIIYSLSQINNLNYWTKSGLIGLSKQYRISSKLKGNVQVLWDFLSYSQMPKTQPIIFRIGYNF